MVLGCRKVVAVPALADTNTSIEAVFRFLLASNLSLLTFSIDFIGPRLSLFEV